MEPRGWALPVHRAEMFTHSAASWSGFSGHTSDLNAFVILILVSGFTGCREWKIKREMRRAKRQFSKRRAKALMLLRTYYFFFSTYCSTFFN